MNSYPSSTKSCKELTRFSESVSQRNARVMRTLQNRLKCRNRCSETRSETKSVCIMSSLSSKNNQSSGNSGYHSVDDGGGIDGDKETCYVSVFQVCMNYLFPRAFPMPFAKYRFRVKCNRSVSDSEMRVIGKLLSPADRRSKCPKAIFVQSPSESHVTKIYCSRAEINNSCRNNK